MKPGTPQGMRDFGPETVRKRNYIFKTIKEVFELHGFEPLETPAMENLDTLMGKYGEEGDKLIYQIRSNKNLFNSLPLEKSNEIKKVLEEVTGIGHTFLPGASDKALRYDLTIPFARYVATNYGQLVFPFKRYQMQPVWRADRPQKGRYREFYQCDADIAGSYALLNDVELAQIYLEVFLRLRVNVDVKINSRKILTALAHLCGGAEKMNDITVAIDKFDKVGLQQVKEELKERGLSAEQIGIIHKYLTIEGDNQTKLTQIKILFKNIEEGQKGIEELEFVLQYTGPDKVQIDFTLARGLHYYTGIIYEVKAKNVSIGSIGGGGRYDDLTGLFGVPNVPGVGISFGVDRIYDVMEELALFPKEIYTGTKVLFFNMGEKESRHAFEKAQLLRSRGIPAEVYHEQAKMDKQFRYATKKNIPFAVIIGSKELLENTCVIKDLTNGEQRTISFSELESYPPLYGLNNGDASAI